MRMACLAFLVSVIVLLGGIGCSHSYSLPYQPIEDVRSTSQTSGRVAVVCDFVDDTRGPQLTAVGLPGWDVDIIGQAIADMVADGCRSSGLFAKVIRVPRLADYMAGPKDHGRVVSFSGRVTEFRVQASPHLVTLINPLSLGMFIGLPSGYGQNRGSYSCVMQLST